MLANNALSSAAVVLPLATSVPVGCHGLTTYGGRLPCLSFTHNPDSLYLLSTPLLMTSAEISQRYQRLLTRSFARHLDLFLTTCYYRAPADGLLAITSEAYEAFQPTREAWTVYLRSQQAKSFDALFVNTYTVGDLHHAIEAWETRSAAEMGKYRTIHRQQCLPQAEFQGLFTAGERACSYCRITEAEFAQLIADGQVQTRRLRTRGTTFEADCREPWLGYAPSHVTLCCYWCNNAKTDEFTPDEFQPVANALARVWRQRLDGIPSTRG
ncbi:hypothetical protein [Hymenobacter sp. BT491]|uniref:hypothetical protein n=1 Tax=Hymenobacter sp. BT491 TaxID=2766779 RepID=UPI0016538F7E|nr:hypothetical protein [Hymenobacter sp. BT491]MBC6992238.1 hypothetical protein [Hymenobacter sp. BT491]